MATGLRNEVLFVFTNYFYELALAGHGIVVCLTAVDVRRGADSVGCQTSQNQPSCKRLLVLERTAQLFDVRFSH